MDVFTETYTELLCVIHLQTALSWSNIVLAGSWDGTVRCYVWTEK